MLTANYIHQHSGKPPSAAANKRQMKFLDQVGGYINSQSGGTAALAVNYCVTKGYLFTLKAWPGVGYTVTRDADEKVGG